MLFSEWSLPFLSFPILQVPFPILLWVYRVCQWKLVSLSLSYSIVLFFFNSQATSRYLSLFLAFFFHSDGFWIEHIPLIRLVKFKIFVKIPIDYFFPFHLVLSHNLSVLIFCIPLWYDWPFHLNQYIICIYHFVVFCLFLLLHSGSLQRCFALLLCLLSFYSMEAFSHQGKLMVFFFTSVWLTTRLSKCPGLISVFWLISTMLYFG